MSKQKKSIFGRLIEKRKKVTYLDSLNEGNSIKLNLENLINFAELIFKSELDSLRFFEEVEYDNLLKFYFVSSDHCRRYWDKNDLNYKKVSRSTESGFLILD
jgi:hypothetical protein